MRAILDKITKYFGEWEFGILQQDPDDPNNSKCWTRPPTMENIPYLRAMNMRAMHIFLRPHFSVEDYFLLADDLNMQTLKTDHKIGDQWKPGRFVVETSPGNYQVWIKNNQPLSLDEKKYWLKRLNSDPGASPLHRWGRSPGFSNRKTKYYQDGKYPLSRLVWIDYKHTATIPAIQLDLNEKKIETRPPVSSNTTPSLSRSNYETNDDSRTDFRFCLALMRKGASDSQVRDALLLERGDWNRHQREDYLNRTIRKARAIINED